MTQMMKELADRMQHLCTVANRIVATEGEVSAIERDLLLDDLRRLYDIGLRLRNDAPLMPARAAEEVNEEDDVISSAMVATMAAMSVPQPEADYAAPQSAPVVDPIVAMSAAIASEAIAEEALAAEAPAPMVEPVEEMPTEAVLDEPLAQPEIEPIETTLVFEEKPEIADEPAAEVEPEAEPTTMEAGAVVEPIADEPTEAEVSATDEAAESKPIEAEPMPTEPIAAEESAEAEPAPEAEIAFKAAPMPSMEEVENSDNSLLFDEAPLASPQPEPQPEVVATPEPAANPEPQADPTAAAEPVASPAPDPQPAPANPAPTEAHQPQSSLIDYMRRTTAEAHSTTTIGDTLAAVFGVKATSDNIAAKKVSDLRTVININDKFSFMSELFRSNMKAYNDFILNLNAIENRDEALAYVGEIAAQYRWDADSAAVKNFYKIFDKKF